MPISTNARFSGKLDNLISKRGVFTQAGIRQLGNTARVEIRKRVQRQGLDKNLKPMKGYSPKYKKIRADNGRGVGIVDLTVSGKLWESFDIVEIKKDKVKIAFIGSADRKEKITKQRKKSRDNKKKKGLKVKPLRETSIENGKLAFWLNQDRKFFGVDKNTKKKVLEVAAFLLTKFFK